MRYFVRIFPGPYRQVTQAEHQQISDLLKAELIPSSVFKIVSSEEPPVLVRLDDSPVDDPKDVFDQIEHDLDSIDFTVPDKQITFAMKAHSRLMKVKDILDENPLLRNEHATRFVEITKRVMREAFLLDPDELSTL